MLFNSEPEERTLKDESKEERSRKFKDESED